MELALERVSHFPGIGGFLQNGAKNACNMWFGILPTVMCIGTIALICANYTNIFQILGTPFLPLLKLQQVPDASAAASTMIIVEAAAEASGTCCSLSRGRKGVPRIWKMLV